MPKAIEPPATPAGDVAISPPVFDVVAWVKGVLARPNPFASSDIPPLPHPDGELLELTGQSLELEKERWAMYGSDGGVGLDEAALAVLETKLKNILGRARKTPATTPAGVFCKALLVRRSKTGAAILAQSLAADLINSPDLRRLLWPAGVV